MLKKRNLLLNIYRFFTKVNKSLIFFYRTIICVRKDNVTYTNIFKINIIHNAIMGPLMICCPIIIHVTRNKILKCTPWRSTL